MLDWNPFALTTREKVFFFFHLCEIDRVTADLIRVLGALDEGGVLELRDAGSVVCRVLHSVLDGADQDARPSELPALRTARDLAATIALEMELPDLVSSYSAARARPRPVRRIAISGGIRRKTTKNTDHQTVPRLEQLTDLGFVRKHGPEFDRFKESEPRRRWRWAPTAQCKRWQEATIAHEIDTNFLRNKFGRVAIYVLRGDSTSRQPLSLPEIARWTWEAYRVVRRPVGHTPLESIALYAMIDAVAAGVPLEMEGVHRLMLAVKRASVLPELAQFAGGNGLDEMFVRLGDGFVQGVARAVEVEIDRLDGGGPSSAGGSNQGH